MFTLLVIAFSFLCVPTTSYNYLHGRSLGGTGGTGGAGGKNYTLGLRVRQSIVV
jgi:hypothetical protein